MEAGTLLRKTFATKSPERLIAETEDRNEQLKKGVGALDIVALGIGGTIGTGVFVIIGEAIGDTGPAIILSFVLAGVTALFSAFSYAELASAVPVSGSAYTYIYATLGEIIAWIIGWDLILEYGLSIAAIASGWGQYLNDLLGHLTGGGLPTAISEAPGASGGSVNLPSAFLVIAATLLLLYGVRESARVNTFMVAFKVAVLGVFIVLGATAFNGGNLSPFSTGGFNGIVDAAALIFFAYIGFDAVSTASEEVKDPQRDMPRGIIGSLLIVTLIYILVGLVATSIVPSDELAENPAPLAFALDAGAGYSWGAALIDVGALVAIASVVLTIFYGQTRIMFAMCRDGLLPRKFATLSSRQTPIFITIAFGVMAGVLTAFVPLEDLAELVNIGTLFAFFLVNAGLIVLRRTKPDLKRGFRVPLVPLFPLIGMALCVFLMTYLEALTWLRFGIWMIIGLTIYFAYGRFHSRLQRGEEPDSTEAA
jgi:basic amino acid/polyamine antiporter, APA family